MAAYMRACVISVARQFLELAVMEDWIMPSLESFQADGFED